MARDHGFARMRAHRVLLFAQAQLDEQHARIAAAEQRQRAVRRHVADRLAVGVVVAELLFLGGFLALDHGGGDHALVPQVVAHLAEQLRGLAELFGEDVARAVQRGLGVGHAAFRGRLAVDELGGLGLRVERGIGEQRLGQRLQAAFAGDLRAGAALGLVGQVEVFQHLLGLGCLDGGAQRVGQLALFLDGSQDGRAAVFQLAQVQQALFQVAQLRIVQVVGGFLAVARDERHGGAFIQQLHGGGDLLRLHRQLGGDAGDDLLQHGIGHCFQGVRWKGAHFAITRGPLRTASRRGMAWAAQAR